MDYLSLIKQPIERELADFIRLFNQSLTHDDGLLAQALRHIRERAGKRMRPMLILLMAKNFGRITEATQQAAVGLELLHTASLVHDDVVDESGERRGQASVNALYDNKVAVLVGDYILSTALLCVSKPFLLPQRHPWTYYDDLQDSYNTPDFTARPVDLDARKLGQQIMGEKRKNTAVRTK